MATRSQAGLFFTQARTRNADTHTLPELATRGRNVPPPPPLCASLAGWPAVRYGPVQLALTPVHLPKLTPSLPHHSSRRTKCALVSWQCSLKCQPGVTNPCRSVGPRRRGSVGRCPVADRKPGTCQGNNNCRWTTGALPSCPGWIELVRAGRG